MSLKEFTVFTCPHCKTVSQFDLRRCCFPEDHLFGDEFKGDISVRRCLNCGKKVIWIDNKYIYPDVVPVEPVENMPDEVKELFVEAGTIYGKSPRAACALLRLAIDRLCHVLGENDRDINKNIGALVKKGLSVQIQQALDIVRVVGNKAVHPGQIVFDVDDFSTAETLMALINMIVERMITEPQKILSLFEALPDSAKEAIKKRDAQN